MKIELNDLGPIKNFEFDLSKDINVIFGQNNIGKSYAITAIYLILKNLAGEVLNRQSFELEFYYHKRGLTMENGGGKFSNSLLSAQKNIIAKIKNSKLDEIEVTEEFADLYGSLVKGYLLENLEKSFKNSFTSIENLSNRYRNEKLSIKLNYEQFDITICAKKNEFQIEKINLFRKIYVKKISTNRKSAVTSEKIVIYFNSKAKTPSLDLFPIILNLVRMLSDEVSQIVNKIYFLPASRSGLYQALSTFSAVIAELSKSRNFLTNRIELPNISEPVSDYFLSLSNISTRRNSSSAYRDVINEIEKEILKGEISFSKETKKIVFSPSDISTELDLSFTSSMISEIAPIVAFLKYIISDDRDESDLMISRLNGGEISRENNAYNILFIEEPEAHLHPSVQVKLMSLFSKLCEKRIKIIMTSHSNYMFNKLSNLILSKEVDHRKVGSYLMKMTEEGSVVDKTALRIDQDGIVDENFVDTAEQLYEERIAIYDKLNENAL